MASGVKIQGTASHYDQPFARTYTCPAGKTFVGKAVLYISMTTTSASYTANASCGSMSIRVIGNNNSGSTQGLEVPVVLSAGESISMSASVTSYNEGVASCWLAGIES
jgi:hypothetical protein